MQRSGPPRTPALLSLCAALAVFGSAALLTSQAAPLASATVTRVENKVSYGKVKSGRSQTRPAAAQDVVKANDFLLSESDSRAELKYDDGSVVRIGQNTIFSFDANTRTLTLDKGTFVFFIPKGAGGATIKTPSITAAITGTVGKVSENTILIIEGEIELVPSGKKVGKGEFVRRNADGTFTFGTIPESKWFDGKLMTFNGPMPGTEIYLAGFSFLDQRPFDPNNLPSGVEHFFPKEPKPTVRQPSTPEPATPVSTPDTPPPSTRAPFTPPSTPFPG